MGRDADSPGGFGPLLRCQRVAAGLTQEQLAERTGLSVRSISDMERGITACPRRSSMALLAAALGLDDRGARALAAWRPGGENLFPGLPVPRQLPAAVPGFVGREAELRALSAPLDQPGGPPGTVLISAIDGTAGVGKTALAVYWAHSVAWRFGDGQLYVNLHGFGPPGPPVTPAEVVRGFLDALEVPPEKIPARPESQAALYRSLLVGRRLLIVLDNARDTEQVRPLLPGSPGSLVVVTSRAELAGLAAIEGARLLTLDVLTGSEAVELLARRLGRDRVTAEPAALTALAGFCARLPLALAIAAARAAARPRFPLAVLAAELRDDAGRLDALDVGDAASSVQAVFSWSCRQLTGPAARLFRLLSVHPGPDISAPAAASLTGSGPHESHQMLGELTRAHLISEHAPGRYAFHDLLRAYAAEQARAHDGASARRAALHRVLDHYLHTAYAARLLLRPPPRPPITLVVPQPGVTPESPGGYQQALDWFTAEHQVLLAVASLAAETGFDVYAWQLPWSMADFLVRCGYLHERAALQRSALEAATRLGDKSGQAAALLQLGAACHALGDYDQARDRLSDGLGLYRQIGDLCGEARVRMMIGSLLGDQGRDAAALSQAEQALDLFRALGDRAGQAGALNDIGCCHAELGHLRQARVVCEEALALQQELGNRIGEAVSWDSLGRAEYQLGNLAGAAECYQRAMRLFRELRARSAEAEACTHLGDIRHADGDHFAARTAWLRALDIFDDLHHPQADKVRERLMAP